MRLILSFWAFVLFGALAISGTAILLTPWWKARKEKLAAAERYRLLVHGDPTACEVCGKPTNLEVDIYDIEKKRRYHGECLRSLVS